MVVDHDSDFGGHRLQTEIIHGLMLEYDHYSNDLSILYYDFGLTFDDYELVMNKLEDKNVFTSREIDGDMATSPDYARAAIALVPKLSTAYSIWDYITSKETQGLKNEKIFDSTYEKQAERYDGSVIRGINGDFSQYHLDREGHYALLKGQISYPTDYYTLEFGYRYTASHNL